MSYIIEHTKLAFCWWDVLALVILAAVIAVFAWKVRSMKKEEQDLQEQLSELYADDAVGIKGKHGFDKA